jgi:hypothetical protein
VDGDNACRHHRLDDVARLLTCQVIVPGRLFVLLSVGGCHVADSDMAPASCVKKRGGEGGYHAHLNLVHCSYTSRIIVVGPLWVAASPFSMWPLLSE